MRVDAQWIALKDLMEEKKLSVQSLSYMLKVSRQTVYKWLHGVKSPGVKRLKQIAAIFASGNKSLEGVYLQLLLADIPICHKVNQVFTKVSQ